MLPLMCELWDRNEFSYATKTKSSYVAKDLCVGLIGGCVPEYIRKLNRDATTAITGGFTSRCIFVYANEKSQSIAWPNMNGQFNKLGADLAADLQNMSKLTGEFTFSIGAKDAWEIYYAKLKIDQFDSDVLTGFKARMKSHIFKTAMCLCMSETDRMTIENKHLQAAIKLIEDIRDKVDITFRSVGESPLASQQARVELFIKAKGVCGSKDIYSRCSQHMTYTQFEQVLWILEMAGKIRKRSIGKGIMYETA